MKKMKRLLALMLVGAMCIGTVLTANAAEFNAAWYAAKNPDVVAVMGNSPEALKLHYDVFGKKEHRMANEHDVEAQLRRLFNAQEYAALYPDVKAVFGDNEEAMFNHYISYGILENRRPSEKVSGGAASELRKTVVEALTSAGLDATPGSAELVAIITDSIPATAATQAVQTAMTKTQAVVEKAVETVTAPQSSGSSGSSGSSSSSSSNTSSSDSGSTTPSENVTEGANPCESHNWVDDNSKSTAATCVKDAVKAYKCDNDVEKEDGSTEKCTATKTVTQTGTATGHTEKAVEDVKATCTTTGLTGKKICSVCNTVLDEGTEIPALGHTEEDVQDVEATCTTTGLTGKKICSVCNTVLNAGTVVPALDHNYVEGVCSRCGDEE